MKRSFRKFESRLAEGGLRNKIETRALKFHVSLRELYEGSDMAPSIMSARRAVYRWLVKSGKGINEVARLFDRAPSGVWRMAQAKRSGR